MAVFLNLGTLSTGRPPGMDMDVLSQKLVIQETDNLFVPRFYRDFEAVTPQKLLTVACLLGSLIGAVHFLAWNSAFPSHTDQTRWRVFTAFLTAAPIFLLIVVWLSTLREGEDTTTNTAANTTDTTANTPRNRERNRTRKVIVNVIIFTIAAIVGGVGVVCICLASYGSFVARVGLLVEAIIALRDLPPKALADIDWVQLIPHW